MSILEYLGPIEKVSDYISDSSDEDEWDPYRCRGELSPGIPFLACSDEDPDSEDVHGCGEDEVVETLAKRVRAANRLVEEMPYHPKYGFNYATNKSDCARQSKAKEVVMCHSQTRGPYGKGPVIANKAERTRRLYARKDCQAGLKQTQLDGFLLKKPSTTLEPTTSTMSSDVPTSSTPPLNDPSNIIMAKPSGSVPSMCWAFP
ncbi:uncharacterized protein EI90DRAFT_3015925 [Cantharellus anzutake]|uniref:uncharacterized protein n=1 Tax=Cantharellus anzutake TaxID=1750568 RepID=UPI0019037668|nr:uncharacterized protein EI90DRAFT_3015925 [Cantharellus anzutake]KAF8332323.1 hypothetical protein EI90DRAFT_3015925 [Cantharellus anzutake]